MANEPDQKVVISTNPGYAFDATSVEGVTFVVTEEGQETTREEAEAIRAEARSLGVQVHVRAVKEEQQ